MRVIDPHGTSRTSRDGSSLSDHCARGRHPRHPRPRRLALPADRGRHEPPSTFLVPRTVPPDPAAPARRLAAPGAAAGSDPPPRAGARRAELSGHRPRFRPLACGAQRLCRRCCGVAPVARRGLRRSGSSTGTSGAASPPPSAPSCAWCCDRWPSRGRTGPSCSAWPPPSSLATCGTMIVAAHAGGSLTHGEDYLTEHAPAPIRRLAGLPIPRDRSLELRTPIADRAVFDGVALRIFERHCTSCHNPGKLKGDLKLDTYDGVLAGGLSGPVVIAGAPAESELLKRLHLPLDDKKHMPPKGRPPLTDDESAVLTWWVEAGAPAAGTLRTLKAPAEIRVAFSRSLPEAERRAVEELQHRQAAEYETTLAAVRAAVPGSLRAILPGERDLEYTAAVAGAAFGDAELEKLAAAGKRSDLARPLAYGDHRRGPEGAGKDAEPGTSRPARDGRGGRRPGGARPAPQPPDARSLRHRGDGRGTSGAATTVLA